ncbi:MAG: 50S ribosomal protein L22 [Fimbriimonadaceae bacterium]|nr:50S ribosomal protein L22 [Fimbriimonadaceae bacterium]QYK55023.1 MAG: 50S ribosomal protein L22 [Fimbriimonadaceae bacterium]
MEVRAVAKYVRVQPRKVRIVADEVRGKSAQQMVDVLRFHPSKGAFYLCKVIKSAMANAVENHGAYPEGLRIQTIMVDEGPHMKRIQARAMGRANRILKKTSHITVVVEDFEPGAKPKPHGTKAKSRPKFVAPKKGKAAKAEEAAAVEPEEVAEAAPVAAAEPEEATPVTVAEAPESEGGSTPEEEATETKEGENS